MLQLSLFDEKCFERFKIKELILKNFKRIHGEYRFKLSPSINIITPNYEDEDYEITETACGIDFEPLKQHVDTLCQNDMVDMIKLLKNERDFELWDYSFFSNDKYISVGVVIEKESGEEKFYERKKRYRGVEQIGEVLNYREGEKTRFRKINNKNKELMDFKNLISNLAIYPHDYPVLDKVKYSKNFYNVLSQYPMISIKDYIEDINNICEKYNVKFRLIVNAAKEIEIYKDTSSGYDDCNERLLELAMLIALEKQLGHSIVFITHGFKFTHIYDNDLDVAMEMLNEFVSQGKQVILLYDNPYNIWDWDRVIYNVKINNKINDTPNLYKAVWFNEKYKQDEEWDNVTIKLAARELIERQELSIEDKIKVSKRIIRKALFQSTKPAIAVSYGKDSMVMLDIVKRTVDEIKEQYDNLSDIEKTNHKKPEYPIIVFCDTGVEFPEHYTFIREQEEYLRSIGFMIYRTKPKTNFFKIVDKKGFPMFGKSIRKDSHPEIYRKIQSLGIRTCGNYCCEKLKEEPSAELYKELKVDLAFVGLLAVESRRRREGWYVTGDIYYNQTEGYHKALPIIHFKEEDIFKYIETFNVSISPLYSMGYWKQEDGEEEFIKYTRTGCWPCSMSIQFSGNNMEMLRNTHPKLWNTIMVKKGLAKEIYKFKHGIKEEKWTEDCMRVLERYLEVKPCHFDTTSWKIS
ncbi:phosphoadenosine phosphosulfate reductase family protein [Alkaliphilus sp. B6464]|uniref:phosphoadenosine phosphosulfate reductase family protein n=1 Tax=Alkaliphilus sp. B6464 TaxID=2731219 RepID=UPI001BA50B27|nr:phosphoadenosine phosphosulfate reductase family protein [Alkaliphilus sp. B6464]QUH21768.1 phosphoadenosine phosphosulfate reductase family protein [Alkaliphilus sp. B6464]